MSEIVPPDGYQFLCEGEKIKADDLFYSTAVGCWVPTLCAADCVSHSMLYCRKKRANQVKIEYKP